MASDISPPVLKSISFSNPVASIGVTGVSLASLGITVAMTDDLSGIYDVRIQWVSPAGNVFPYIWLGEAFAVSPESGSIQNGSWRAQEYAASTLTQFQESGVYALNAVMVKDKAGNSTTYYPQQLKNQGFNVDAASFQVFNLNSQDLSPPVLKSISFSNPVASIGVTGVSLASLGITVAMTD